MSIAAKPVPLRSWSFITTLNGLGEAILTATIGTPGGHNHLLLVSVNPRTCEVCRVALVRSTGETTSEPPVSLPYIIRDLAETVTRERFPLLSQPIRHGLR